MALEPNDAAHALHDIWRQLGDATSRAGIPCRQSKPALKRPAGATQRKVASHTVGSYVWLPGHMLLWMAGAGGGTLVLGGLWMRRL